jgi:membrane associated rhomboid family serine protease
MYVSARELRLVGCARLALVATVLFVIIALFAMILIFVMIAVIGAFSGFVVAVVSGVMMGALMVIVRTKVPTHTKQGFKLRRPHHDTGDIGKRGFRWGT